MYLMEGRKHWRLFRSTDREFLHPRGASFDVDVMCPDIDKVGEGKTQTAAVTSTLSSPPIELAMPRSVLRPPPKNLTTHFTKFGSDLAQTQPYDAIMQPGDLMFIPSGSPHQVLNLDDTLAVR